MLTVYQTKQQQKEQLLKWSDRCELQNQIVMLKGQNKLLAVKLDFLDLLRTLQLE